MSWFRLNSKHFQKSKLFILDRRMGALFSSKKDRISDHDRAVLDLKIQRDKLRQYQKKCEKLIEQETKIAKDFLRKGEKQRAMYCLKKKKFQLNLLEKSEGQLANVEQLVTEIETQQMNVQIFNALKEGNNTLNQIEKEIGGIEAVEDLLADTEDAIERQNEIAEALSGAFTEEDNEDLEAELAALEAESESTTTSLPDVPSTEPQHKKQKIVEKQGKEKEKVLVPA